MPRLPGKSALGVHAACSTLCASPHNLRDTAASLAIQAGASVVAVARLLGHESAATTLNHHAGLFPSDRHDVANRLDPAARQTIAKHSTQSGATEAPITHRAERSDEDKTRRSEMRAELRKREVPPAGFEPA